MRLNKQTIRPFNVISTLLLLCASIFVFPIPYVIYELAGGDADIVSLIVLVTSSVLMFVLAGAHLLAAVFRPKIILGDDHMEILHWSGVKVHDKKHPFRIPQTKKTIISYGDLKLFGGFFAKDIAEYRKKGSGILSDTWMRAAGTPLPISIRLDSAASQLRDLLLFVTADGTSCVIDGGLYGLKQVENLLYELEQRTGVPSAGRVDPRKHSNHFVLNILCSMLALIGFICWFAVLPMSATWLEGFINPLHGQAYQSLWRHLYILSLMLANLCILGYIVARKTGNDADIRYIRKVFGRISIVLYIVFGISFSISLLV